MFIGDRSHHKHSMYVIMHSDLFGLTRKDIALIALVARYHRRATPRPYHEEYTSLDRDSRIAVAKMAALLRVADALDRDHMQQARTMAFTRELGTVRHFSRRQRGFDDRTPGAKGKGQPVRGSLWDETRRSQCGSDPRPGVRWIRPAASFSTAS